MRTTLSINDALLKELRQRTATSGKSFRAVVEETLQLGLARNRTSIRRSKFKVAPHPLHLKPGFRGLSMNQLYDQLEAEDAARHQ
jgi:hypothetical protein